MAIWKRAATTPNTGAPIESAEPGLAEPTPVPVPGAAAQPVAEPAPAPAFAAQPAAQPAIQPTAQPVNAAPPEPAAPAVEPAPAVPAPPVSPAPVHSTPVTGYELPATFMGHAFTASERDQLLAGHTIFIDDLTSRTGNPVAAEVHIGIRKGDTKPSLIMAFPTIPATYMGHRFTDEERAQLNGGGAIMVDDLVSKAGKRFTAQLHLGVKEGQTKQSIIMTFPEKPVVPDTYMGHTFTQEEIDNLNSGYRITVNDLVSKAGKVFTAQLYIGQKEGANKPSLIMYFPEVPDEFMGYYFDDDERDALERGDTIIVDGLQSKKGNFFKAMLHLGTKPGSNKRTIIMEFDH